MYSSSRRANTPTRVRSAYITATRQAFEDVLQELDSVTSFVQELQTQGAPESAVAKEFETWTKLYDEWHDVNKELCLQLEGGDLDAQRCRFDSLLQSRDSFGQQVRQYLLLSPSFRPRSAFTPRGVLNPEMSEASQAEEPYTPSIRHTSARNGEQEGEGNFNVNANNCFSSRLSFSSGAVARDSPADIVNRVMENSTRNFLPLAQESPATFSDSRDPSILVLERLADIMETRQQPLPALEPEVFGGNPLKFPAWISAFELFIEARAKTNRERLRYLGKYVKEPASRAIAMFLPLYDDPRAYENAKRALVARYGDKMLVAEAYRKQLHEWPQIADRDAQALQNYADFLWQCHTAIGTISYLSSLDSKEENLKMARKLPNRLAERWIRIVDAQVYGSGEDAHDYDPTNIRDYPRFEEFCKYVSKEARVSRTSAMMKPEATPRPGVPANRHSGQSHDPRAARQGYQQRRGAPMPRHTTHAVGVQPASSQPTANARPPPKCMFCSGVHYLSECTQFLAKTYEEKKAFARQRGVCYGCLRRRHRVRDCHFKNPSLMQDGGPAAVTAMPTSVTDAPPVSRDEPTTIEPSIPQVNTHQAYTFNGCRFSSMIVPVNLTARNEDGTERQVLTYALLDTQSDGCFITEAMADELNITPTPTKLEVTTITTRDVVDSGYIDGLVVGNSRHPDRLALPRCYTREEIPYPEQNIPTREDIASWGHLQHLAGCFPTADSGVQVGMLIGYNCPEVFALCDGVFAKAGYQAPFAMRSPIGWTVLGRLDNASLPPRPTKKPETTDPPVNVYSARVRDVTPESIKVAFDAEFVDNDSDEKSWSVEDREFMRQLTEGVRITEDGMIELPLPFKKEPESLPETRARAVRMLLALKRKFERDSYYKDKYVEFVEGMIKNGYAEVVPESDLGKKLVWYLTHHGVFHPRKKDKIRVVFNPSAEVGGITLNKLLLQGPDMTNNLSGVLMRFREEKTAFVCDVESMFYRVLVSLPFRDYMRFVWFRNGDPSQEIVEYRMTRHVFGATSSPGCANFALKFIADTYQGKFGPAAAEFLKKHFYVDDGLRSVPTVDHAISLIHSSHGMCKAGGMNLCKFSSNSPEVIAAIPESLRSKELQKWCPGTDQLPTEPTLGMGWGQQLDCLNYLSTFELSKHTRRAYLSSLSSVFDPLGLVGPVLLVGRQILQELCLQSFTWDEEISGPLRERWTAWFSELTDLNTLRIPRCFRRTVSLPIAKAVLHVFTDASLSGYGVCCYIQLTDLDAVDVTLVYAKSRVAPTRRVPVPRLELQAAVLGVKVGRFVAAELSYPGLEIRFWSDSQVVLAYIMNESRRFHTFVGNRVSFIREKSDVKSWGYVQTDANPADFASRGMTVQALISSDLWWTGPDFLAVTENRAVEMPSCQLDPQDPELKRTVTVMDTVVRPKDVFLMFTQRYSSWDKILHLIAWLLKFKEYVKFKAGRLTAPPEAILSVSTIRDAQNDLIRRVQADAYPEEYAALQGRPYPTTRQQARERNELLKRSSNLYRLDPFVGEDNVMRVGGRIRRAHMSEEVRHPILLPKKHHVTTLLIQHVHLQTQHAGRGMTLARIRSEGYWIVNGRSAVGSLISACFICRRLRYRAESQLMADLPTDRISTQPPFTYAAVDFFGPYYTRRARSEEKRYGCLFICQSSRAVHLEMAVSLSTDDFLLCYRRFVGRRGPVRVLRCDQGTNLVGAHNDLEIALQEMDVTQLSRDLLQYRCDLVDFRFNPPAASHMGGSWERLIRSVRAALDAILIVHRARLTDAELSTFFVEAENVVNSRPLCPVSDTDPELSAPLTPFSLLTMKDRVLAPLPGVFEPEDVYARKRWRTIQYLANQFWLKWKTNFLPTLQIRHKWNREQRNLTEGDIVLVVENNTPRSQWKLARVIETYPGEDGLVRSVKIKTAINELVRPITKLVLLSTE